MDFDNINASFHNIVTSEDWELNKLDVAELYLNDNLEDDSRDNSWETMDGLTIMFVPGYGRLQMIWIQEEEND